MPWCPNCKAEYREGFTTCSECNVALVNELPEDELPEDELPEDELPEKQLIQDETVDNLFEPCILASFTDYLQQELVKNVLLNNNIPCYSKDRRGGNYLRICMEFSIYGVDLYVNKCDYEKAKELLEEISGPPEENNSVEPLEEKDNSFSFKFSNSIIRMFILTILLFSFGTLISFIINAFFK